MSDAALTVSVRGEDRTTPVLDKAGEAYLKVARTIVEAEKQNRALAKAQVEYARVSATTSDGSNPKLAASFANLGKALEQNAAAQKKLELAQKEYASNGEATVGFVDRFVAGLKGVGGANVEGVLKGAGVAVAGFGALAAAAGASVLGLALHAGEAGSKAADAAARLGTSTEFISSLGYAAKQSGTSIEEVEGAITKLGVAALKDADDFKRWGLSLTDANGKLKTNEQLFYDAADVVAGLKNPLEKTTAAQNLFGKSGANLVPLLNDGSKGIKAVQAEATRLGITLSTDVTRAADAFGDSLDTIKDSLDGLATQAGAVFLPVLTEAMDNAKAPLAELVRVVNENKEALQAMAREGLATLIGGFASLVRGTGFVLTLFDDFRKRIIDMRTEWVELKRRFTWDNDAVKKLNAELTDLTVTWNNIDAAQAEREQGLGAVALSIENIADAMRGVKSAEEEGAKATAQAETKKSKLLEESETERKRILSSKQRAEKAAADEKERQEKEQKSREEGLAKFQLKTQLDLANAIARGREQDAKNAEQITAEREAVEAERKKAQVKIQVEQAKQLAKTQEAEAKAIDRLAEGVAGNVVNLGVKLGDAAVQGGGAFKDAIKSTLSNVRDQLLKFAASSVFKILANVISGGAAGVVTGGGGGAGGFLGAIGGIFGFSDGGLVGSKKQSPGPTDTVPALLTPGEMVLSKPVVDSIRRGGNGGGGGAALAASAPGAAQPKSGDLHVHNHSSIPTSRAEMDRVVRDNIEPAVRRLKSQGLKF